MGTVGLREAHNGHFIKRLLERGPEAGTETMDELARALNRAKKVAGTEGTVYLILPGGRFKAVLNAAGEFITLSGA
jgi:hypothetical protein